MRTILITGPGGGGRTTVAAATALGAARRGTRTLVLSTDRTDTLGAALGAPTRGTPTGIAPQLTAWRPDPAEGFRAALLALQEQAAGALDLLGSTRLDAEELTPLPGAGELALLRALRDASAANAFDLLVVDLPPAPEALALLALPEQLRRYLRRLLPAERQAARALRPVLGRLAGVPMPTERLYETAARWDLELAAAQRTVEDPATTVRLVAEPGPAGADAVRSATTGLALRGLRTDALIANRVLPDVSPDTWLAGLAAQQRKALDEWRTERGPASDAHAIHEAHEAHEAHEVHEVPHLGRDPRGAEDLAALSVPVPAPGDAPGPVAWPVADRLAEDGVLVWHIPLPGALREELDLVRRGDELLLRAGQFRRTVTLPSALRRCSVDGASLREGELRVRFVPDADLWPRTR